MAINFKKIWTGLTVVPKTASTSDSKGELEVIDGSGKLQYHNGTSVSPVVTEAHSATLTNKTLTSPVINTGVSGTAIDTDGTLAANSDTLLASQKAVKTYVDTSSGAVQNDVNDLVTLSGVAVNSTDLGTFTGTTIPDASTVKGALQALETGLEAHITDTIDAHDASAISNVPAGSIAATDVQAAINELDGDIQGHITDTVDAHDASAISSVPSGNLAATDVQGALNELQTDVDTRVAGPGSSTDEALARFDGTTGKLVQNSVATLTDAGVMAGLTGLTSSGTIDSTGTMELSGSLVSDITTDSSSTGANATVPAPATTILRLTNASLSSIDMISSPTAGRIITVSNQTGNVITINNDTGATAANRIYTGTGANLTLKNQATLLLEYDSTASRWLVVGGTGAGTGSGINYITNSDAEAGTTGWATYADAAGTVPVDGTGGSPNSTIGVTTSSPLRGTQSFLFTKNSGASRQGEGVSFNFTIDSADQAKILRISMDYETSPNYVDTVSGNLINSDMQVFVYDVTNAQLIYCDTQNIAATTGKGQLVASFQTASNSTSYRLIFHIASSTNTNAYTLKFDNVVVGPQTLVKGPVVTDWVSYTPTGTWTTNATYTGRWRRVGDSAEIEMAVSVSASGATGSLTFNLPSGLVIDTSKLGTSVPVSIDGQVVDASSGNYNAQAYANTSTSVFVRHLANFTGTQFYSSTTETSPYGTLAAGDGARIRILVPIVGWSSNLVLSEDTGNRLIAAKAQLTGDQTVSTANSTLVTFNTVSGSVGFDTTASFNTSSSRFVAPETGYYFANARILTQNLTAGDVLDVTILKNGSTTVARSNNQSASTSYTVEISGTAFMTKGDYLEVYVDSTADTSYSILSGVTSVFEIVKISSPQTLAGSETVAARAVQSSGQSIPNSTITVLTWDSAKTYDTHNALNTSTGTFTAPVSGIYRVGCTILYNTATWTNVTDPFLLIKKNGSSYSVISDGTVTAGFVGYISSSGSDSVYLSKGDTLTISANQSSGAAKSIIAASTQNFITIELVK